MPHSPQQPWPVLLGGQSEYRNYGISKFRLLHPSAAAATMGQDCLRARHPRERERSLDLQLSIDQRKAKKDVWRTLSWPAKTVIEIFQTTVERFPNEVALCYKRPVNGTLPEEYTKLTYREYWHACMLFAKALIKLDVQCFDIVNILGFNS
eukprot:scaffold4610_cov180-Ochromonas_danica.AAC.10